MIINSVELSGFRNHKKFSSDLKSKTYISGNNGSGKTSIIEAVYLLLALKSFRSINSKDIKRFGDDFFRIKLNFTSKGRESESVYFFDGTRKLIEDGEPVKDIKNYIFNKPVICYSPEGNFILSKDQVYRRNFIDRLAFYLNQSHYSSLTDYKRLIRQKYAELSKQKPDFKLIDVLDIQIISNAENINKLRRLTVDTLNEKIENTYKNCNFIDENYRIRYDSNIENHDLMEKEREKRKIYYGTHRDRLYSFNSSRIYDKFSSFGQKKTFELVVLFSFLLTVEEIVNDDIIFLLDDFEAGLDKNRLNKFMEIIGSTRQTIITGVENRLFSDAHSIHL